jgi:hypothetical protein
VAGAGVSSETVTNSFGPLLTTFAWEACELVREVGESTFSCIDVAFCHCECGLMRECDGVWKETGGIIYQMSPCLILCSTQHLYCDIEE